MLTNPIENINYHEVNKNNLKFKKINNNKGPQKKEVFPGFVEEFGTFLINIGYSSILLNKQRALKLCKDLTNLSDIDFLIIDNFHNLTTEHLKIFEGYILRRISNEEINHQTAYNYLKNLRLFCKFLYSKKIIHFKYSIPKHFIVRAKRLNQYISKELVIQLLKNILSEKSDKKYRVLAIITIILETGCRPIELSNLKLSDLNFSEKTIILFSNKSGQRKLSLNKEVIDILKLYMQTRNMYNPKSDSFFLTTNGDSATSKYISLLINEANKKAFNEVKINARSLRHTFVTNAFENNNDFDTVSKTLGHKHWSSTLYYLHRSKKRLLQNTLSCNPLKYI